MQIDQRVSKSKKGLPERAEWSTLSPQQFPIQSQPYVGLSLRILEKGRCCSMWDPIVALFGTLFRL